MRARRLPMLVGGLLLATSRVCSASAPPVVPQPDTFKTWLVANDARLWTILCVQIAIFVALLAWEGIFQMQRRRQGSGTRSDTLTSARARSTGAGDEDAGRSRSSTRRGSASASTPSGPSPLPPETELPVSPRASTPTAPPAPPRPSAPPAAQQVASPRESSPTPAQLALQTPEDGDAASSRGARRLVRIDSSDSNRPVPAAPPPTPPRSPVPVPAEPGPEAEGSWADILRRTTEGVERPRRVASSVSTFRRVDSSSDEIVPPVPAAAPAPEPPVPEPSAPPPVKRREESVPPSEPTVVRVASAQRVACPPGVTRASWGRGIDLLRAAIVRGCIAPEQRRDGTDASARTLPDLPTAPSERRRGRGLKLSGTPDVRAAAEEDFSTRLSPAGIPPRAVGGAPASLPLQPVRRMADPAPPPPTALSPPTAAMETRPPALLSPTPPSTLLPNHPPPPFGLSEAPARSPADSSESGPIPRRVTRLSNVRRLDLGNRGSSDEPSLEGESQKENPADARKSETSPRKLDFPRDLRDKRHPEDSPS